MVEVQSIKIPAHNNIYTTGSVNLRELRIDFGIPDNFNDNTGIFLLVPGFGGNIDSKIYKKLLKILPDKYNIVTVQCEYFGSEFMQEVKNLDFIGLQNIFSSQKVVEYQKNHALFSEEIKENEYALNAREILNESIENYADLSFMQAIDILTAIKAIQIILRENGLPFNEDRVLAYGQSQGAYLLLLANRIMPNIFSFIIDNSAWEYPKYLTHNRINVTQYGKSKIKVHFDYFAKKILDFDSLRLNTIYKEFENKAYIFSILGAGDTLLNIEEKKQFITNTNNTYLEFIDLDKVDGEIYKSIGHGLDANFIKLIDHAMKKEPSVHHKMPLSKNYAVTIGKYILSIDNKFDLPLFELAYKENKNE